MNHELTNVHENEPQSRDFVKSRGSVCKTDLPLVVQKIREIREIRGYFQESYYRPNRSIRPGCPAISTSRVENVHTPPEEVATAYTVPEPFGPEMGILRSAVPPSPAFIRTDPETMNPASTGSPNASITRGSDWAV